MGVGVGKHKINPESSKIDRRKEKNDFFRCRQEARVVLLSAKAAPSWTASKKLISLSGDSFLYRRTGPKQNHSDSSRNENLTHGLLIVSMPPASEKLLT